MPQLNTSDKKHLRSIGHKLSPVVMIGDRGISEGVEAELERALNDHELIKIKVNVADPGERREMIQKLCESHKAELIQSIGKMALLYPASKKAQSQTIQLAAPYLTQHLCWVLVAAYSADNLLGDMLHFINFIFDISTGRSNNGHIPFLLADQGASNG